MAYVESLVSADRAEALAQADRQKIQVGLSVFVGSRWISLRCPRLSYETNTGRVRIHLPAGTNPDNIGLAAGQACSLKFTIANRSYVCVTNSEGTTRLTDEHGPPRLVLLLDPPHRVERISRRAAYRVQPPEKEKVRATFWPGGYDALALASSDELPAWSGHVNDLSNGGCGIRIHRSAHGYFETGDVVGLRVSFGADQHEFVADAQVCHIQKEGSDRVLIGFRFTGIDQGPGGWEGFQYYLGKIRQYRHEAERAK